MNIELKEMVLEEIIMKSKKDKMSDLEKDLIPSNPNIIKRIKHGRRVIKKISNENRIPQKPIAYIYSGEINPLKDAYQFMRYYRAFIQGSVGGKVKFDNYESDSLYATQILDILIENKRSDRVFLNAWIKYFCDYGLKGEKSFKPKYTSLKVFKETFEKFNNRFKF